MDSIKRWWGERSDVEKWVIGGVGVVVTVATGGAAAYAISTGGAIFVVDGTVVAVGAAATALAKRV
ncbi:MAG: hypothetical protein KF901_00065 [Myxococcales bacterium]|nr:hypothetical protein [Myxococcales bacterium]